MATTRHLEDDYLGEAAPHLPTHDADDWQARTSAGSRLMLAGVIVLWAVLIYVALRQVTG